MVRPPKMAVPTRTMVLPAWIAASRSPVMPMESVSKRANSGSGGSGGSAVSGAATGADTEPETAPQDASALFANKIWSNRALALVRTSQSAIKS